MSHRAALAPKRSPRFASSCCRPKPKAPQAPSARTPPLGLCGSSGARMNIRCAIVVARSKTLMPRARAGPPRNRAVPRRPGAAQGLPSRDGPGRLKNSHPATARGGPGHQSLASCGHKGALIAFPSPGVPHPANVPPGASSPPVPPKGTRAQGDTKAHQFAPAFETGSSRLPPRRPPKAPCAIHCATNPLEMLYCPCPRMRAP